MKFYIIYLTFYISPAKQVFSEDGPGSTEPLVIEFLSSCPVPLDFLNCEWFHEVLPEGVGAVTNNFEGSLPVDPSLEVAVEVDPSVVCFSRPG